MTCHIGQDKQHTSPCADCPFNRKVEAGALGGSPPEVYVGQIQAGFMIPCHSCIDFSDENWKAKASRPGNVNQCAGAAIFRSNIGRVNPVILTLPKNTDDVFASYQEFVSHHLQADMPPEFFTQWHIDLCVDMVMRQPGVTVSLVKKGSFKS